MQTYQGAAYAQLAFFLLLVASLTWAALRPTCAVDPQPRQALAPLRFLRVKATVEDRLGGRLTLVDTDGPWTSSLVQAGPRTTWVEWRNVVLGAGDYEVVWQTAGGCTARGQVSVN